MYLSKLDTFNPDNYTDSESAWLAFRRCWLEDNPPLDNGCYLCGICNKFVPLNEVTLDHIQPREASNMFDPANIQPAHGGCNYRKGSKRWKPLVSQETRDFLRALSEM